jgi:calcyclin binding protein
MVLIEEVIEEPPPAPAAMEVEEIPPSEERLLDAQAIEQAAANVERASAKLHMESLAKKLRKESAALKRVEESRAKMGAVEPDTTVPSASSSSTPATDSTPSSVPSNKPAVAPPVSNTMYTSIDRFSFDAGGYSAPFVTLYVPLPSVGSIPKDNITCNFTASSFDLIVEDLVGKSYRLYKDNLEHNIDPEKSKYIVKADKVLVKLAKIKGDYGSYDMWNELTAKKKKKAGKTKDDPSASIMELMKDMYDSGDADMKRMIGETMEKQRRGELNGPPKDMDMGM